MVDQAARASERQGRADEMLSARVRVVPTGLAGEYLVRSQSGKGIYRVKGVGIEGNDQTCSCPDFEEHSEPCKHILLIHLHIERQSDVSPSSRQGRKQYPQNWAAYDKGQTEEIRLATFLLADLVNEVPEIPRGPGAAGRPPISLRDGLFCAILKVYHGVSGRRARSHYVNAAERGSLTEAPSFMVASRALNKPEATSILYGLLRLTAAPLAGLEEDGVVAPDSTGIQTTSFGAWREAKHSEKRQREWLKVHAMVGTKTHVIIRAVVGEANSGDSPQFGPLLRGTLEDGFRPSRVVADKGYLSKDNYRLASDLGLEAYIPFKSNSLNRAGNRGSPQAWRNAYYLFQMKRPDFDAKYHQRSNAETVFSALKRKFGENIRSKNKISQINEVLCKLIAYNLTVVVHEMFENGVAPSFAP